jgi:hypothetical protein
MKKGQQGIGLSGLLMAVVVVVVFALLGMKVGPEYVEFFQIKKALKTISGNPDAKSSVAEVRKAFERQANIDNISAIRAEDLEVSKEGGDVVVSFAYERRVPLFANVSLLLEFQGSSQE